MGMEIIDLKATKYKRCYKCVRYCRVKAIQVKDEWAIIMLDKCTLYGHCLKTCPQLAKILRSDLNMIHGFLRGGMRVVVSIAPSYMGLLKYKTTGQVWGAPLRLESEDVREISRGIAFVTAEYAKLLAEHKIENIITTCCPSANDLVGVYCPQLISYLAPVVSPMIAHGEPLKEELGRDAKVVLLGSYIAKKKEALDLRHEGYIDAVLNLNDINKWPEEEDIVIEDREDRSLTAFGPRVNRPYPVINSAVNSVLATEEKEDRYRGSYVHEEGNCIDPRKSMSRDEIEGRFIGMNMRPGGCIKDPMVDEGFISRLKMKLDMEESIYREPVEEKQTEPVQENINLRKRFEGHSPRDPQPTEKQIQKILHMANKLRPEDELNCGACGYPTCREKTIAIFQCKAEVGMCISFTYEKTESVANLMMETSPNIVLIVGDNVRIMEYSDVDEKYFGRTCSQALQMYPYELIDLASFQQISDTHQNTHGKRVNYPEYNLSTPQSTVYVEKENAILATFIDITREEELAKEEYERKLETIGLAQKAIHEQMTVAREIVGLLGETAAKTGTTLTRLCHSLLEDNSDAGYAGGELERETPGVQLGSGAVPLRRVITAGTPRQMPEAEQIPGAEHMPGAGERKKPTGYAHIGSASPRGRKSGYVHLSNMDLKEPGGNGGK